MVDYVLDIATRIVNPEQNIWAVFPGTSRRYFSQFAAQQAVFLEVPGIALSERVFSNDDLLRQHVAMSQAIADFSYGRTEKAPSRRPSTYPISKSASFNAAVGNVRNMYERMRPGDLVLVGGRSYWEPILVGEVVGRFDPNFSVTVEQRFGNEVIPARKVRWIQTRIERRFLSHDLAVLLSNRKAVITIDQEKHGEEIYKFAYGDYVFGTDSRYVFRGPKYRNIATTTVPGIRLITYLAAAFNAAEINELTEFAGLSIDKAIDNYFEQDVLHSFELDFSSPGEYVLDAKRAALPLLVAVMVAATSGGLGYREAKAAEIINSAASMSIAPRTPADPCVEIEAKYREIMNSINADRFNEICKINKDAQDGVGLKVDVKVKEKKDD